jgi:DNA-binding beta-propeller fold protein YncE
MLARRLIALGICAASLLCPGVVSANERTPDPATAVGEIPDNRALRLLAKFPIPEMTGTWDHLAGDAKSGRLFLTAQDEHAIDVLDVTTGKLLRRLTGAFNRPQGQYFIAQLKRLVTSNGRDGTVRFTNTDSYEVANTVQLSIGADLMQYDAKRKHLYIESGGKDSNRGVGKISIVDATSGKILGEIVTDYRAAAMAIEKVRPRLYVAIPALNQVLLVDTAKNEIVGKYDVPGRPGFIGLDEKHHRLFVSTRKHATSHAEPIFNVIDTESEARIATFPTIDDTSGIVYDAVHCRIYTTGLSGFVHAIRQIRPDRYETIARFPTGPHAGTSYFMPELNRFFVAVPPHESRKAEVWVFEPLPNCSGECKT